MLGQPQTVRKIELVPYIRGSQHFQTDHMTFNHKDFETLSFLL